MKPLSGSGGPQQAPEVVPTAVKARRQAEQTTSETVAAGGAAVPTSSLDEVVQHGFVTSLRIYAEQLLYPGKSYSVEKHEQTIREGVFNNFIDELTPAQWTRFHEQCMRRIELVRDYVLRRPNTRFVPAPYSEITPGHGYFDWENQAGFRGTELWFMEDEQRKHVRRINDALDLAETELKSRRKYEAHQNPSRMKTTKRVKALTRMQLYHYHHKRLFRLGGEEALIKFTAKVAALLS